MYPLLLHKANKTSDDPTRQAVGWRNAIIFFAILYGSVPGGAWAAPIATNTALPLSADEVIIRQQFVMTRSSDRIAGTQRQVDRLESRTVLGYGSTSKLAFFGVLPLVAIDSKIGDVSASESGLGDAALFARYEVFRSDQLGRTLRIAPYAGVRLPTGRDGKTGDGSVDVFGGLIVTIASTKWNLDSQLRYDRNREADGFERGDSASFESSFQYRLAPGRVTQDTTAFVFGVLELSANEYERNRIGGVPDPNSGGFQLYLTPGLQYSTRRWIADFGVKIPIANDLNGTALEPDYSILTSIRINF
ncbi:MAG: transporter [Woeseia sp.]